MSELQNYTPSQLTTIRNTVAKDCNRSEFDLFLNAARSYGLDPFRKQISAIIYNKDKPDKRKMSIIVGRDGLRSIAQRCGDYRPASGPPTIDYNDDLEGPTNPKGIISISVELFKRDASGDWYPVFGQAMWDEFVPAKEIWKDMGNGRREPSGEFYPVDGNWKKMPVVMLTKCAEAQALRAGWPDVFSGLYTEEEMPQQNDVSPSEAVDAEAVTQRQNAIGKGKSILMTLDDTGVFQRVEVGAMADRCLEYIRENDAEAVHVWAIQNREPLKEFWAVSPNDALDVKRAIEKKTANIAA